MAGPGRSRVLAGGLLLGAALAAACSGDPGTAVPTANDLEGSWHLVDARDSEGVFPLDGREITLVVKGDEVSGTSGCNLYGGTVTVRGSRITVDGVGGTEMACEPAVMESEQRYLAGLSAVRKRRLVDGVLVLSGPDVALEFRSEPHTSDAGLVRTSWVLEALVAHRRVSRVVADAELAFVEGGLFGGTTGCRQLRGRYELDGEHVSVTGFQVHGPGVQPCTAARQAQHEHVVDVLRDGFTATIDGDRLAITDEAGLGLDFRAR